MGKHPPLCKSPLPYFIKIKLYCWPHSNVLQQSKLIIKKLHYTLINYKVVMASLCIMNDKLNVKFLNKLLFVFTVL